MKYFTTEEIERSANLEETASWWPGMAPSEGGEPSEDITGQLQVIISENHKYCDVYRVAGCCNGYIVNEVIAMRAFYPKYLKGYFYSERPN